MVAGGAALTLVSPGDQVGPEMTRYPGMSVAVSTPELTAYQGVRLRVRASNSAGQAFIGVASPVDIEDYTRGVNRYEVKELSLQRLSGTLERTRLQVPAVAPQGLDLWSKTSFGPGERSLDLRLDGSPVAFYVGPHGKAGDLTLSVTRVYPGARRAAVALTLAGGLAAVAGVALLFSGRRLGGRAGELPEESPVSRQNDTPVLAGRAALILVPVLGISACVPLAQAVEPAVASRPAMYPHQVAASIKALDARTRAAQIQSLKPPYRSMSLHQVYAGPVLDHLTLASARARAKRRPLSLGRWTSIPGNLYAQSITAYPARATVASVTKEQGKPQARSTTDLNVLTREHAVDQWRLEQSVEVPVKHLPKPRPAGAASTPTPSDVTRSRSLMRGVGAYLVTGRNASGLALSKELQDLRRHLVSNFAATSYSHAGRVSGGGLQRRDDGTELLQVTRTQSGLLVVGTVMVTESLSAKPGKCMYWKDAVRASLAGESGDCRETLSWSSSVTVAIATDDAKAPRVLGISTVHTL